MMALFGLVAMSDARASPQRRNDTAPAVDENKEEGSSEGTVDETPLQGEGSLEGPVDENTLQGGGSWGGAVPKCPKYHPKTGGDAIAEDDLLSGGKHHPKPKLVCYTYEVTPWGYEYA